MLDPSTQAVILRDLKARQNARGFSLLFISHDIHLARKIADRVYVLEAGALVQKGAAFEVFAADDVCAEPENQLPLRKESNR
jgi:peptide/nickel transport system ATP-binding protein